MNSKNTDWCLEDQEWWQKYSAMVNTSDDQGEDSAQNKVSADSVCFSPTSGSFSWLSSGSGSGLMGVYGSGTLKIYGSFGWVTSGSGSLSVYGSGMGSGSLRMYGSGSGTVWGSGSREYYGSYTDSCHVWSAAPAEEVKTAEEKTSSNPYGSGDGIWSLGYGLGLI